MSILQLSRILIVDDEVASMRALCDTLRDHGYETAGFSAGKDALQALREAPFDLLLTDLMMPEMDGVALLGAALKIDPQLVGILMTGRGTIETAVQAMKAGALDYVLKPIKLAAILPVLSRAVSVRRLRLENMELRDTVAIHELSQAMAYTLDRNVLLDKIADAALAQFDADEASIMLVLEDGRTLCVAAVRGEQRSTLLGECRPLGEGIAGWVADRREPLVLQAEVTDSRLAPLRPRAEIQSALSMPMITRNKLIGVLNINCIRQRRAFTLGQIKVLSIFTSAAAAGIEAARLYEDQRKTDARYREVLDMAADGIISIDDEQHIVVFNSGAEKLFGYRAEELIGKPLDILLPAEVAGIHRHHVQVFGQGPDQSRPMAGRSRLSGRRRDGTLFNVEAGVSKRREHGSVLYTAVMRDITERLRQEDSIARLTRLYAVLSGVNSAIVRILDEHELYSEICRVALEQGKFTSVWVGAYDANAKEIVPLEGSGGDVKKGRFPVDPKDPGGQGLPAQAVLEKRIVWENDLAGRPDLGRAPGRGGDPDVARAQAVLPFLLDNAVVAVMILNSDTAGAFGDEELRLLHEMAGDVSFALDHIAKTRQLDYLSTHDLLTGLPNRTLFLDRLTQAIAAAKRKSRSLALVLTDIERFKHFNDTFGRQAGDALLRQFANRLRKIIPESASLARVGADVFAVIDTDFTQASEVAKLVRERADQGMAEPFATGGQEINLAARSGVAFFPGDGEGAEAVFRNAEAALKRAKGLHEPIAFYTPQLNASVAEQLALESKLRRALERNEFILHYQPKVDFGTGTIAGLEALLRWRNPEAGLVGPMQFIPILEETGLIIEVGRWAMKEAVRMAATLRAKGLRPVRIAVNVSPIQLRREDFVRSVEEAVAEAGAGEHGLDLEITESVLMHDIEANAHKLNELRGMDIELAIDDFGTGYSSLGYIATLPINTLKIDRSFITNLLSGPSNASIVSSIISLAHSLNLKVVAEGVELKEQAKFLQLLRCDQIQGYLFSPPVPQEQVEILLAEGKRLYS